MMNTEDQEKSNLTEFWTNELSQTEIHKFKR